MELRAPLLVAAILLLGALAVSPAASDDKSWNERYAEVLALIETNPVLQKEWRRHVEEFNRTHDETWPPVALFRGCPGPSRSATKPTSVHRLLPGDIDVIGALGDSLTAANGASAWTVLGCLTEYRGKSWSIGGDKDLDQGVVTLPNILRSFNPNLKGFSTGSGDVNSDGSKLNVAYPGKIAQDMPSQAHELISRILADRSINFREDWKMVTLFIGGNNLCDFCSDTGKHSAETYVANVRQALDILQSNLPRAYVNLVEIFDITPVAQLGSGFICGLIHNAVCSCGHGNSADLPGLSKLSGEYQRGLQNLMNSGRYSNREDFTVILQPFLRETVPPNKPGSSDPDLSFFAPDCFHFSEKGHYAAAKGLWHNLIQPIGSKATEWNYGSFLSCPQPGQFLPTIQNAQ